MTAKLTLMVGMGLSLAACHGKQPDAGKSAAAAEVLPGSASDAMIGYDTLKSQPPLATPSSVGSANTSTRDPAITTEPRDAASAAPLPDVPAAVPSGTGTPP